MTKPKLQLLNDWLLVKMDPESNVMGSGLVKPDGAYESVLRTGKVMATGPGMLAKKDSDTYIDQRIPTGLEVGDGVVFNRFLASRTKIAAALQQAALSPDEALIRPNDELVVFDHKNPPRFS